MIDGVARVDMRGDPPATAPEAELMMAQLAATLRQDPSIAALRVTIGGEEVDLLEATTEYDVSGADAFDPTYTGTVGNLYGLRRGRVVVGGFGELDAVNGPFGIEPHDLASVAVSPGGRRVAAVTGDGRQAVVGPLRAREDGRGIESLVSGTDLTRPTWDASGRLWLLDRGPDGARLLVSDDRSTVREVEVPGVTGTNARRILVSRDGTRLVALVGRTECRPSGRGQDRARPPRSGRADVRPHGHLVRAWRACDRSRLDRRRRDRRPDAGAAR